MKISILGYGPIPEKLVYEPSQYAKVELFTSQKISNIGVPIHEYDSFLKKELDFDVLILAWRGLPKNGTEKADVLRYLVKNSPTRSVIINLSSVSVYGQNTSVNTEETETVPINVYGYSKLFLERYLNMFANSKVCNLRISNVFGDKNFKDVINSIVDAAASQKSLELVSPQTTKRDFISISTLIYIINSFINENEKISHRETFNVSSGKSVSLLEVKNLIEVCLKRKINFQEIQPELRIIETSYVSNSKTSAFLNFRLGAELEEINKYVESILD